MHRIWFEFETESSAGTGPRTAALPGGNINATLMCINATMIDINATMVALMQRGLTLMRRRLTLMQRHLRYYMQNFSTHKDLVTLI